MRVLEWMLRRVQGQTQGGQEHLFGTSPVYEDLLWNDAGFTASDFDQVISTNDADWRAELALHDQLFEQLHHHLPASLQETRQRLAQRLPV
jgi:phosphoenolpyruvate carboxykinase (GTP)